jgi:hypothetical protein
MTINIFLIINIYFFFNFKKPEAGFAVMQRLAEPDD